jgi:hypothetical protein
MLHTDAFDPSLLVYQWNSIYPQLTDTWKSNSMGKKSKFSLGTSSTVNSVSLDGGTDKSSFRLGLPLAEGNLPKVISEETQSLFRITRC